VLGLAVLVLWFRGGAWQGRTVAVILATCWLFVAWAYLLANFDSIIWAASYFAASYVVEALLLVWTGLIRNRLSLRPARDSAGMAGLCIFVFALFVWPLVGRLLGRPWLQAEIFGIAPDPTVVATLGVLMAADRTHWELLVVPLLWCAISGATLWAMQSPDALAGAGRCAAGARSSLLEDALAALASFAGLRHRPRTAPGSAASSSRCLGAARPLAARRAAAMPVVGFLSM
jgi:hypothetical protein